ncbi:Ku protein [Archangium sp.]|uniref:non-homologous end joining protein Ku n=1 Tax=Archangium sp. TaxID=1872627 RepID=UPI00286C8014|nr:Ku protein [Archangium sp.]
MSRPVWTGSIGFGPIHVPVRLHGAVSPRQLQFHLLHDADGGRIQQRRVCSLDGEEVPYEHVVKGYELSRGRYVELTRGELEAFDPQASRTIDIEDFVELSEIDPLLFDTTYHLMPSEGASRAYATLAMALRAAGRVGIGRLVMHMKGHLCAVWSQGRGLVLSTLHYADELIPQDSFAEFSLPGPRPAQGEVEAVLDIIEARTVTFEPLRYHDTHRERLLSFIERRVQKRGLRAVPSESDVSVERPAPRSSPQGRAAGRADEPVRGEVSELSRGSLRMRPLAAREVREPAPRSTRKRAETPLRARRKKEDSGSGK